MPTKARAGGAGDWEPEGHAGEDVGPEGAWSGAGAGRRQAEMPRRPGVRPLTETGSLRRLEEMLKCRCGQEATVLW